MSSRRAWSTLAVILFLLCLQTGCTSPYATQLPVEVVTWDGDAKLQKALAQLSDEERALLDGYSDRMAHEGSVGGKGIVPGTTVYAALEDQRTWEADQARLEADRLMIADRKEAERQGKIDELKAVTTATVVELTLEEASLSRSRLADMFEAKIQLQNLSDRPVDRVRGTLVFTDREGAVIKSVLLVHDDGLQSGDRVVVEVQLQYSALVEGDVTLSKTPLEQLTVAWEPNELIFSDGTRLGVE